MGPRSILSRPLDLVIWIYLLSHIAPTFLIDTQAFLPANSTSDALRGFLKAAWLDSSGDPFVGSLFDGNGAKWFEAIMLNEFFIETPLMFYCIWALWKDSPSLKIPGTIYATQCITTTFMILFSLFTEDYDLTSSQFLTLASVYGIYIFFPILILYRCTIGWPEAASPRASSDK
ncbi:transmembrane protein 6/97 [Polychytrium aggregatum]|uniref:transmembrane protein 6/97 n=1 Tax=Polychytrium aggregatum TaxID=110093 RepID=UPI0022FE9458|nr:transmembrane protein 6/97 [Polychytrium aggregatum]KAI9206127.1 transmembrane protein 6/97 [Polychytrium aggregatum]